jgi:parallel beta-helix repeat protein
VGGSRTTSAVQLRRRGVSAATLIVALIAGQFTAAPHIALAANPAAITPVTTDFGVVRVNRMSGQATLHVSNTSPFSWSSVTPFFTASGGGPAPDEWSGSSCGFVAPGSGCDIIVQVKPNDLGARAAKFSVATVPLVTSDVVDLTLTARATYDVNVTADTTRCDDPSGPGPAPTLSPGGPQCTLRGAILLANASPGRDAIGFAIPGTAPLTINPLSALPSATEGVIIDATNTQGIRSIIVNGDGLSASESGLSLEGTGSIVRGLVVNTFPGAGFSLSGSGAHRIEGSFIGTNFDGTRGGLGFGNKIGVAVSSSGNVVGGSQAFQRNVISGNAQAGIGIGDGAAGTTVTGNYIGTNAAGTGAVPNGLDGLSISGPDGIINANVISGNGGHGVFIGIGGPHNVLTGNRIGTTADGTARIANTGDGVHIANTDNNVIEGLNVISGNGANGVSITLGSGNTVRGNLIGTNAAGSAAIPNTANGVDVDGAANTMIGGTARNVISGNAAGAVHFVQQAGLPSGAIKNNYVGIGSDGETPIGNAAGLLIVMAYPPVAAAIDISGNRVGNSVQGIWIIHLVGGQVSGNVVGETVSGAAAGNTGNGIWVDVSDDTHVTSNTVRNNGTGVLIDRSTRTEIRANDIRSNQTGVVITGTEAQRNTVYVETGAITHNVGKGIQLAGGANGALAAPTIDGVNLSEGLTVFGHGTPNDTIFIHADAGDEGQYFLGQTGADGITGAWTKSSWAPLDITSIASAIAAGTLKVTAIDKDDLGNTSEFSAPFGRDITAPPQPPPPSVSGLNDPSGQTWTGFAEPGSTVKLYLNCTTSRTLFATAAAPADANGAYTIGPTTPPAGGVYNDVCVTATDASGNVSLPSAGNIVTTGSAGKAPGGGTVVVDTTPPAVTIGLAPATQLGPAQAATTNTQPVNFLATFTNGPTGGPEFVYGFASGDVAIASGCGTPQAIVTPLDATSLRPLPVYQTSWKFNIQVRGMTANCTVTVSLPAGAAEDAAKNLSTAASSGTNSVAYTFVRDTTAPVTTITGTPSNPSSANATFAFTSNEFGSTFQCSLDTGTFALCASPQLYTGVVDGPHTFNVKATDVAGNVGAAASFQWSAQVDTDGDGLLDNWESLGYVDVVVGSTTVRVELPDASANRKDIYVQIDWMQDATCHLHKPSYDAIKLIYDAFDKAGIKLHVDIGPDSPRDYSVYSLGMSYANYPAASKWGAKSRAGSVTYVQTLGAFDGAGQYLWTRPTGATGGTYFDDLKNRTGGFSLSGREPFYHYALWAHQWDASGSSGLSRSGGGSGGGDFMVSLGLFAPLVACGGVNDGQGTVNDQAGSFMHELGHNLGLAHGGGDSTNRKPNYVSVMSYAFQNVGLTKKDPITGAITTGIFDYSDAARAALNTLNEASLSEATGSLGTSDYGSVWTCPYGATKTATPITNASIDWNCNGVVDAAPLPSSGVNINADGKINSDAPCVGPGPDGKLDTVPDASAPGKDDYVYGQTIRSGDDRVCSTAAALGSDDVQLVPVGTTGVSTFLAGFNDWANIKLKIARIGQPGFFAGAPEQTLPEDQDLRAENQKNLIAVAIDIAPGDSTNTVPAGGTIDVALMSSPTFVPTTVVISSVRFGPAAAAPTSNTLSDVNGDGRSDVVFRFAVSATGLVGGTTQACLTGVTSLRPFSGCDIVTTTGLNHAPSANAGGPYKAGVGAAITFSGTGSDPDSGDTLTFSWTFGDGSSGSGATASHAYTASGCYQATLTVADSHGASATSTSPVTIGTSSLGPVVGPSAPVAMGTPISLSGGFLDPIGRSHSATWTWDDGTTSPGTVSESSGCGAVTGTHTYTAAGVYVVTLTLSGGSLLTPPAQLEFVVVYDPSIPLAGGLGSFSSPVGACKLKQCAGATGPATFGFFARVKVGTPPLGGARFQFRAGSFSVRSASLDSAVISGDRAQLKGSATVNGNAGYAYSLTVTDGALSNPAGADKIRLKVWQKSNGAVVYDNAPGADDIAGSPQQPITSGAILIQQ